MQWQREIERGAFARFALGPITTRVAIDDAAHVGQPKAGAFELVPIMQALKQAEEPGSIFHIKSRAVIPNEKDLFLIGRKLAADLDSRLVLLASVLDRVGNQINPNLPKHCRVTMHFRQWLHDPLDLP